MHKNIIRTTLATTALVGSFGLFAPQAAHAANTTSLSTLSCAFGNDSQSYSCIAAGTADGAVSQFGFDVPTGAGLSVATGTSTMTDANGNRSGTLDVSATDTPGHYTATLTFDADYVASHPNNLRVSVKLVGRIDTYNYAGPWSITADGDTSTLSNPGAYCDDTCREKSPTGVFKSAWNNGDGTIGSNLVFGADQVEKSTPGQKIEFSDTVGDGQHDCTEQLATRVGTRVVAISKKTPFTGTANETWTRPDSIPAGTAVMLTVSCHVDGAGTFTDAGTISGHQVSASVNVQSASGTGDGDTPSPTPTSPSTTPSAPETSTTPSAPVTTPSATPTAPVTSTTPTPSAPTTKPSSPVSTPSKPKPVATVYQHDTIRVVNKAQAAELTKRIHDGVLPYRGDKLSWGHSKWEFVSLTTTPHNTGRAVVGQTVDLYWALDTAHGAKPTGTNGLAWGPKHNLAQKLAGRAAVTVLFSNTYHGGQGSTIAPSSYHPCLGGCRRAS